MMLWAVLPYNDDDDARAQRQAQRQAYGQAHNDDDDARQGVCQDARRLPGGLRWKLRQVLPGHHVPGLYDIWEGGCLGGAPHHPRRQGQLRAPQGQ